MTVSRISSLALGQIKTAPFAQSNLEHELKRLENEWLNSYLRGNKKTFDRIVAEDFNRIDESGKLATKTRAKEIVQAR